MNGMYIIGKDSND